MNKTADDICKIILADGCFELRQIVEKVYDLGYMAGVHAAAVRASKSGQLRLVSKILELAD